MGKPFRILFLIAFFIFLTGINRGCNLFGFFADKSSDAAKIEDVKVAIAQGDYISACTIAKEFQDSGAAIFTELQQRIADGIMSSLFGDKDFFNCVIGGNCSGTSPICVMAKLNTNDACNNTNCLSVLNNCDDVMALSNYSGIADTIPGISCTTAMLKCSKLETYKDETAANATASQTLIDCKEALFAVSANCPQYENTFSGGPCHTLLNGASPPCTADICNVTDLGSGNANCNGAGGGVTDSNYSDDATFISMSNAGLDCD